MRVSYSLEPVSFIVWLGTVVLNCDNMVWGFVVPGTANSGTNSVLSMVTADEILARARAAVGDKAPAPESDDGPAEVKPSEHFSASILEDIQETLHMLERRVGDGPGSLSALEVEELDGRTRRIVDDLLHYDGKEVRVATGATDVASSPPPPPPQAQSIPPPPPPPPPPSVPVTTTATTTTASSHNDLLHAVPQLAARPNPNQIDTSEDDGPAYDGTGGMGMAKGTANTYLIPGMDEMTGEEYRKALQESISERQERRRQSLAGQVGNRAANQYLDQLGYGGTSHALSQRTH